MTGDERARLEARLAEALGRKVALAVETDPALMPGWNSTPRTPSCATISVPISTGSRPRCSPMTDRHTPLALAPDWLETTRGKLADTVLEPEAEAVGRVTRVADGIARISGLPDAALGALLRFERGQHGFVRRSTAGRFDAVLLDGAAEVEAGDRVSDTGEVLRVPVGPALLGRVVDPLGRPLDGGPPIAAEDTAPVERPAPSIIERDTSRPGRNRRAGGRRSLRLAAASASSSSATAPPARPALAVDAITNQKRSDVVSVYVAIGQRATAVEAGDLGGARTRRPGRCIFSSAPPPTRRGCNGSRPSPA